MLVITDGWIAGIGVIALYAAIENFVCIISAVAYNLRARLIAFHEGKAADATVMTRLMRGYDRAQIEALAKWFAAEGGR